MERLARDLGVRGALAAAAGVVRVAEASMAAALRKVSVESGHDTRAAALVAFGGAGGLHACALAESLGCPAVLFPRHAGLLSAIGALTGGSRRERSRSVVSGAGDRARLEAALARLERELVAQFERDERPRLRIERWADVRYRGQSHELPLRVTADLEARFHAEHRRRFGFADPGAAVEVVTVEVRAGLPGGRLPGFAAWSEPASGPEPGRGARPADVAGAGHGDGVIARVHHGGRLHRVRVVPREAIDRRFRARGPVIVRESGATLWVPPGWVARCHAGGAIVLARGAR
jgi:N-methylhydantoinase A